jgi:hypothetical protein
MSLQNLANKYNELCQRIANLEKTVKKGINIETDHTDTTETRINVPLGGVIRFTSNGSLSQDLTQGSANLQIDNDTLRTGCGLPDDPRQLEMNLKICTDRHNFLYLDLENVELWQFVDESKDDKSYAYYDLCGIKGHYVQITGRDPGFVIPLDSIISCDD